MWAISKPNNTCVPISLTHTLLLLIVFKYVLLYLHINLSFRAHTQTVPFYEPTLRLSVGGLFSILYILHCIVQHPVQRAMSIKVFCAFVSLNRNTHHRPDACVWVCECLWEIPAIKNNRLSNSQRSEIVSTLSALHFVLSFYEPKPHTVPEAPLC